jgi:hypothetical protein
MDLLVHIGKPQGHGQSPRITDLPRARDAD